MSVVTNVMLSVDILENEESIERLNGWMRDTKKSWVGAQRWHYPKTIRQGEMTQLIAYEEAD